MASTSVFPPDHGRLPREADPNGIPAGQPGAKLDLGKAPVFEGVLDYFPRAVEAVALLSLYGANKYSWKGWEKVPNGEKRYANALGRHITKEAIEGEWDLAAKNDPKYPADILHATQQAWNSFARLELMLRRKEQEAKSKPHEVFEITISNHPAKCREQMDPVHYNAMKEVDNDRR